MAQARDFEQILYPHAGYGTVGGSWRCACLHTYERVNYVSKQGSSEPSNVIDPDQETIIAARHAQHMAEVLLAAGATLPAADPRQALRERAAGRGKGSGRDGGVQTLRDGSLLVPPRTV